jgi:hypothetical protein
LGPISPSSDPAADESFSFDALMIHAWLSQLLDEAVGLYVRRRSSKNFGLQTGQAQRGFLRIFGSPKDTEFHRIAQNMYRFTSCDDPLAVILFRALDALSAEHESAGDFTGIRAPDASERPREAVRWMRESMDRWCEWIDAFVHLQTHAQWHLAPESFDTDPQKRQAATEALRQYRMEQFRAGRKTNARPNNSDSTQFYRELPIWQVLRQAAISQPQRPWPHPELDEAIISLWPLVKRHHWTFGDFLNVLGDLVKESEGFPCEGERNLTTYCLNTLRLRKSGHGKTAQENRPAGYVVALRLFPPLPPRPVFSLGLLALEDALDEDGKDPSSSPGTAAQGV